MMAYEQKELSGSLFKNDKREKDTHPNATGSALIGGVEYWVSAWTKKDKNGNPWQSLAFKPKIEKTATGIKRNPGKNEEDETIPF
jgi:hypothetical protein